MRIAVAYDKGLIGEHFGHAEMFAVYDYPNADVERCTKRLVETVGLHGHQDMAELMRRGQLPLFDEGGGCSGNCGGCSGCGEGGCGDDCDCGC